MAAIDLELGLEHRGRRWGQERPEMLDNFDLEMQEWEDQLQDIQRKIEELYNEVQTRRGANDINDHQKNGVALEYGPGRHDKGLFMTENGKNHPEDIILTHCESDSCNYGYGYRGNRQNGHCHADGVSEIGDLLQDYLGNGKQMSRKNNGARHVRFSDTIKVSQDVSACQGRSRRGNQRLGQEPFLGNFEESENRKNRVSPMRSSPCRETFPNKESSGAKPPLGQRDSPVAQTQLPVGTAESPSLDRKAFGPGVLGDRKGGSPSVLRKFGAMLQENEGKMLTEAGVVTHHGPAPEAKCPTSCCHRRALGAAGVAGRTPVRLPNPKCQADSNTLTAEIAPGQQSDLVLSCGCQHYKDQRGGFSGLAGSPLGTPQPQRRPQVPGSPKLRPRANSGGGPAQGDKAWKPTVQHLESKVDYRVSSSSNGSQTFHKIQKLPDCSHLRDEGLIELLDMLEIQHNYSSNPKTRSTCLQQEENQDISVKPKKSFSRPARPANQRPPSRWASRTHNSSRISTPSGPIYRSPSPLTRPPSPMARTPSPAQKHRALVSYKPQTETVIM
ncbi:hypothetical protein OJAV_G00233100 [Oryzias javanicus]|uniref:SOGA 1/2-like coiled-coil domain-containing protein n=1 Tax=Oryzias javanicus TaxID=123683 RepID=A0A3S2LXZ7_ORYJA|nr:hypothetical protein OJAV_G00233100 [Oryzias javanicus]